MKIYLISQNVNNGYDTYDSAVVAATSEEDAKTYHPGTIMQERWDFATERWFWLTNDGHKAFSSLSYTWAPHIKDVEVKYLGEAVGGLEAGIVTSSFNAG